MKNCGYYCVPADLSCEDCLYQPMPEEELNCHFEGELGFDD